MPRTPSGLTKREQRFADEWLITLDTRVAAAAAGYTSTGHALMVATSKVMARPRVQAYIAAKQAKLAKKTDITTERVLNEIAAIAFTNMDEIAPWTEDGPRLIASANLDQRVLSTVKKVKVKRTARVDGRGEDAREWIVEEWEIEQYSKLEALDKLAKHLGLFPKDGLTLNDNRIQNLVLPDGMTPADVLRIAGLKTSDEA